MLIKVSARQPSSRPSRSATDSDNRTLLGVSYRRLRGRALVPLHPTWKMLFHRLRLYSVGFVHPEAPVPLATIDVCILPTGEDLTSVDRCGRCPCHDVLEWDATPWTGEEQLGIRPGHHRKPPCGAAEAAISGP